jgi:hypothetical protein
MVDSSINVTIAATSNRPSYAKGYGGHAVPLHPRLWSPPGSMGLAVLPALGLLCLVFPDRLTRTVPVLKQ